MKPLFTPDLLIHHFAYLRAMAEGLPRMESALRYLGISHGAETVSAHREVTDRARAHVRRLGDPRWRLIGIEIQDRAPVQADAPPSLMDWAESNGLSEFSERELQELYTERFPPPGEEISRRNKRNERLRTMRLALLRQLESVALATAAPAHPLEGWLPETLASQLRSAGFITVGDLTRKIAQGGRWWRIIPGFGVEKASRLSQLILQLSGPGNEPETPDWSLLSQPLPAHLCGSPASTMSENTFDQNETYAALIRHSGTCKINAKNDREALAAWVKTCAKSTHTRAHYEREAERLWLFCLIEQKTALSAMTQADCSAYMRFLAHIPPAWISNRRSARLTASWAPFKGELSPASIALSLRVISGLFKWWFKVGYIHQNPWQTCLRMARHAAEDDAVTSAISEPVAVTKTAAAPALSPDGWHLLRHHLEQSSSSAGHERLRWLLDFASGTGLRSGQMANATRAHLFQDHTNNWFLHADIYAKSIRPIAVPPDCIAATRRYFSTRGLSFDEADATTPLVAAIDDRFKSVSVQGLALTFRRFVKRVLKSRKVLFSSTDRQALERLSVDQLRQLQI